MESQFIAAKQLARKGNFLNEWEIVPGRPRKWILIEWLAESRLTMLVGWLVVKQFANL